MFVDADPEEVLRTADLCKLDYVQLHGSEEPEYIDRLQGLRTIKACRPVASAVREHPPARRESSVRIRQAGRTSQLHCFGVLSLDNLLPGAWRYGERANWSIAAVGAAMARRGKTPGSYRLVSPAPRNTTRALMRSSGRTCDLNSQVEQSPGRKDPERVAFTVAEVLRTQRTQQERNDGLESRKNAATGDWLRC